MSRDALPPIAIVGSGRLGRTLAKRLARESDARVILVARSERSRRAALAALRIPSRRRGGAAGAPEVMTDLDSAVRGARWLLLAVPDCAIGAMARQIAANPHLGRRRRVVLHSAGALGPAPLDPLARRGASTGVFHPLLAFPRSSPDPPGALQGGWVRIEGDPGAVRAAGRLASRLGLRPLSLKPRLIGDDRTLYHAAAALVANDLVALLDLGAEIFVALGARSEAAELAVAELAESAARNVRREGSLAAGLTGPVARGDTETVVRHLRVLKRRSSFAAEIYARLSLRAVDIAARAGSLDRATAATLRRALAGGPGRNRTV